MAASVDPVGQRLVQSLAHPGGNITAMRLQSTETIGQRLELLKELVPGVAPVAVLRILGGAEPSALDPALSDHQRRRELCRRLYGDALALSAFSDAEHGATVPTFRSVLPGPSEDLVS